MANANTLHLSGLSEADPSISSISREGHIDPLDIFEEITSVLEQGLGPEIFEGSPESNQRLPESSLGAGTTEPVESGRNHIGNVDSLTLKSNLDELERAIERRGREVEVRILSSSS